MKKYPSDGFTRRTVESDLVPGNCLRMINPGGSMAVFSDCVISRVEDDVVYLLRPMVWSNGATYVEEFSSYTSRILQGYFHTVLSANGEPYTMVGTNPPVEVLDYDQN